MIILKISNWVGRNDNFLAQAKKLSILPTSLDIFDIRQHYIRILYILFSQHAHLVIGGRTAPSHVYAMFGGRVIPSQASVIVSRVTGDTIVKIVSTKGICL